MSKLKSIIIVSLSFYLLVTLTACNQPESKQPDSYLSDSKQLDDLSYTLVTNENRKGITYPQIIMPTEPDKQKRVNPIMKNKFLNITDGLTEEQQMNTSFELGANLHFQGERVISHLHSGLINSEEMFHPEKFVRCLSFDLQSERYLKLSDLIKIDQGLIKIIRDNIKPTEEVGVENQSLNHVIFQSDDDILTEVREGSDQFCIGEDALTLIFSAPHAIGGWAEMKLQAHLLDSQRQVSEEEWKQLFTKQKGLNVDDESLYDYEINRILQILKNQVPEIEEYENQVESKGDKYYVNSYILNYPSEELNDPYYEFYIGESDEVSYKEKRWNLFRIHVSKNDVSVYNLQSGLFVDLQTWRKQNGYNKVPPEAEKIEHRSE
jgi:hypothetical protein